MITTTPAPLVDSDAQWDYRLQIPHDLRAAGVARDTLRSVLSAHELTPLLDTSALLTSELVANALEYSDGPVALRLHWRAERLRLAVWDNNPNPPDCLPVREDSERGRGLYLVKLLSEEWGYHLTGEERLGLSGKSVWCDVTAPTGRDVDPRGGLSILP
ncbi:ATP-binding protein [Streptomyces sp. RKAG337]|uniref:ATP-binding protein n=1 Tax=Streptomyces sp. RKAG337 TaxID=2893404 RepID=UPI0020344E84|nr:ATP-binding protein [Streptomyces sp. RKAG337]MCM2426814.1 ATP-binding protein [Streptomyces sp. RKAG337]